MGQFEEISQSEWAAATVPDIYFSFEYHRASKQLEPDASRATILEWKDSLGIVRLPLILRRIGSTGYLDATSAYGYGGPWLEGTPDLKKFSTEMDRWAKANKVVCTFLRFHPLLNNAEHFRGLFPTEEIGPTAGWDLKASEELYAGMSRGHRKTYGRAVRAGVEPRITVHPTDLSEFRKLYELSMDRLSASGFYRFDENYWKSLPESMRGSLLVVEAIFEGQPVAAVLCLKSEKFLHFHLSGTSDDGRRLGGAVVCRLEAARWAQSQGLGMAHFGGGLGGTESTLLLWKRKFDEDLPLFNFEIGKIVHLESVFADIASEFAEQTFFPPWRSA